jgi:hypothetical protein
MKKTILSVAFATLASVALAADVEKSTTTTTTGGGTTSTTTTKTTTGSGTITEYTPGTTFIVKESSGPVTYHYGKHVTYVTKSGKTIPEAEVRTRIKVGAPVHVHYTTEGDNRVISRVEVDD